jgi:hypothetical protein
MQLQISTPMMRADVRYSLGKILIHLVLKESGVSGISFLKKQVINCAVSSTILGGDISIFAKTRSLLGQNVVPS